MPNGSYPQGTPVVGPIDSATRRSLCDPRMSGMPPERIDIVWSEVMADLAVMAIVTYLVLL